MEIHRAGWACIGMVKGSLSFPSMRGGDSLPPPRMKRLIWVIRCEIYAHGPNAWVPVALLNAAICVVASIAAWTARETYNIPMHDLGSPTAAAAPGARPRPAHSG
jgi:hypothetical protein